MSAKDYQDSSIIRAKHDKEYFVMSRKTAQDESLSFEARGMIAYLLSKPDTWEIQVHDLKQKCAKGRVYRILDELAENGYLEQRTKYRDEKGQWQWTPYILHERPIIKFPEKPDTDNAENDAPSNTDDSPLPENRDTEKRDTEKPDTDNAEILDSTDGDNTDKSISADAGTPEKPKAKSKPKKERDRLFDGVALLCFNIDAKSDNPDVKALLKTSGGRIGKIKKYLAELETPCEPKELWEFHKWYKQKYTDADMPRDKDKFAEHFIQFRVGGGDTIAKEASKRTDQEHDKVLKDYIEQQKRIAMLKAEQLGETA